MNAKLSLTTVRSSPTILGGKAKKAEKRVWILYNDYTLSEEELLGRRSRRDFRYMRMLG